MLLVEEADAVFTIVDSGSALLLAVCDGISIVGGISINNGSGSSANSESDLNVLWSVSSKVLGVITDVVEGWWACIHKLWVCLNGAGSAAGSVVRDLVSHNQVLQVSICCTDVFSGDHAASLF